MIMEKPRAITPLEKILNDLSVISKSDNRTAVLPKRYLQDMLVMTHVIETLRASHMMAVADDDHKLGRFMDLCDGLGL